MTFHPVPVASLLAAKRSTAIASLCAAAAFGAPAPQAQAPAPRAEVQTPSAPARTDGPRVILRSQPLRPDGYSPTVREALLGLGADLSVLEGLPLTTVQGAGISGSLDLLTLTIPATGLDESYLFYQPPAPTTNSPLMVHFHAASVSAYDLQFFTTFIDEAEARNWFILAPFQLVAEAPVTNSYSSLPSQSHVEFVLDYVLANYPIDLDRIYGYGFSMGGGNALNYAARHLDRSRGTFAALVNHTGTLCLTDEYNNALAPQTLRPTLEARFGGPPATNRFEYVRSSVLDLDDDSQLILGGDHTAVNLAHLPIQSWYAVNDPQAHLVAQAQRLDELLALIPGASHTLFPRPGNTHRWDTLDETAVCDWFAAQVYTQPQRGELRIDQGGRFFALDLTVGATDRFAHLFHDARPERFSITQSSNIDEVRVEATEAGLDPSRNPFELLVDTADGLPDSIVITGFTRTPGTVTRDGVATAQGWTYSAGTLTVQDPDGGTHLWSIE
ncbi:MAG: hypothetical protein R3F49_19460 [Planctomycetota bacterium]